MIDYSSSFCWRGTFAADDEDRVDLELFVEQDLDVLLERDNLLDLVDLETSPDLLERFDRLEDAFDFGV